MLTARGRLVYDPRVIADGVEHFDPWWAAVECAPTLLDPHRAAIEARYGVRWGWRSGEEIEFLYAEEAETDGAFFCLRVISEELLDLREALGLSRQPRSPRHLTLGRRKGK